MNKVLVIDDDSINTFVVESKLSKLGYDIKVVNDSLLYDKALLSFNPDLILLDIIMPGKDGGEVLSEIRQNKNRSELPIIMMTAQNKTSEIVKFLEKGANDFITKPFDIRVLASRVQAQLDQVEFSKIAQENKRLEAMNSMIVSYNHEINNPLTIAMGNLEKLKRDFGEVKEIEKIEVALNKILNVVKSIRKISEKKDLELIDYAEGSSMLDLKLAQKK